VKLGVGDARRVLRCLWVHFLAASGCLWWAKNQLRRSGAVIPLTFHRVLRDADYRRTHSLPGIVLLERTFRELVAHVAHRYEPVDMRTSEPGMPRSKLPVAFTFDDGWVDTYTVAFPIAHEHQIPFIVFICPGLIDGDSPFWPERVVALMRAARPSAGMEEAERLIENLKGATSEQREQYLAKLWDSARKQARSVELMSADRTLSWAAIAEMAGQGVSIGSHTQTHQIVTMIPPDAARQEVRESKATIERAVPECCDTFAYPNGNWSPETRNLLAEAGYRLAVTTACGAWTVTSDRLAIPRSNISEDNVVGLTGRFSVTMFEYATFWKAWRATKADSGQKSPAQQQTASATV
jgi:peptidoglycan/xylan/chitin deacetylase (PgdA/CDA1 family)